MPLAAHQQCRNPRCAAYAVKRGYCLAHLRDRQHEQRYTGLVSYTNRRYRWMRQGWLAEHPLCVVCKREAATDLDHIVPHRGDPQLFWDQSNWAGLCASCHSRKTAGENWGRGTQPDVNHVR